MKKYKAFFYSILLSILSVFITLVIIETYLRSNTYSYYGTKKVDHRAEPRIHRDVFFKPKTKKRIVIIGDSMTYGDGIELADTYPYKLQKKLDKKYPNSFEVINMGVMGTDTMFHANVLITGIPEVVVPGRPPTFGANRGFLLIRIS